MKTLWKRCLALALGAALCLAPAAQALTADQLKDLLRTYYIEELPDAVLDADTVEEVLAALNDPYTVYMTAEEFAAFQASMADASVVGIGISALPADEGLLIVGVYDGSPAQALGLIAGDTIVAVDGTSAAGQPAEVISGWLKGEEGTEVSFTVAHADGSRADYTARRAKVVIPATTTELLEDGTTGYIVCTTFGEETLGHFTEGVQAYDDANVWIVDLRDNGGGDVYAVTQALGVFLGEGTMVYLRDGKDEYYRYVSQQDSLTLSPVIALTSGSTASSAEIFALAVKDQRGGMVIGSNTYGKGVAQVVLTQEQEPGVFDGDAIRITSYQYYDGDGTTANSLGVIPDLLVPAKDALDVARLFSSVGPTDGTNDGWARLHLGGWRWYVDLERAMAPERQTAFAELLAAVPPGCAVFLGSGSDWETCTAADLAAAAGLTAYRPRAFTDVDGLDCAHAANTLCTYGMLHGYGDGSYRPANGLSRAELCALLVQAMDLTVPKDGAVFSDVPAGSWYAPYIQAACAAGYLDGVGGGRFDPQGQVTHEQLFAVLGRLASKINSNFYEAAKAVPDETGVPAGYSDWAEGWVWLLASSQKNILGQTLSMLWADPADIDAQGAATRGETAQLLYTILVATDVVPY